MKWVVTGINFGHFIGLFEEFESDLDFLLLNLLGCFGARRPQTLFRSIWSRSV
jgi:hypothetical protein